MREFHCVVLRTLVFVEGVCFASSAWPAGGDLLWQDQVHRGIDFGNALAAQGARVFAVGFSQSETGDSFYVRAYDARAGTLLWEHLSGQTGIARLIALDSGRVFTSGTFFVRGHDARTGAVLWEDNPRGDMYGIATGAGMVFVVGQGFSPEGVGFLVRAYEAKTGVLRWENVFNTGGDNFDVAFGVAVHGSRVFAVGGSAAFLVRAYNAKTGALLWEDPARTSGEAFAVTAYADLIVAAGTIQKEDGSSAPFVRAYDTQTGARLWQDQTVRSVFGWFQDLATDEGQVVAAGTNEFFLVQAYDAHTGARLWGHQSNTRGVATGIVARSGLVFATGVVNDYSDWLVEAYEAHSGTLRWVDLFDNAESFDIARDDDVSGGRIFVTGDVQTETHFSDFVIRAYDAQ